MSVKTESTSSGLDVLKWIVVALLVAVGVVGNSYYSDQSLLYRVIALIVLAAVAAYVALQTIKGQAFFNLFKDAKNEIRRVVWPTRQETTQTTAIVIVVVLIVALILWGMDTLLGWIVSGFIG